MKKLSFIILLLFISCSLTGQERYLDKARGHLKENDFFHAAENLEKALELTGNLEERKRIMIDIAEAYMAMNYFWKAIPYYQNFLADGTCEDANIYKQYGLALRYTGKYEKALEQFNLALALSPNDDETRNQIEKIKAWRNDSLSQPYNPITPVNQLNTAFSEYGLAWVEKQLLFASTRVDSAGQEIDGRTGQGYSRIFIAAFDSSGNSWHNPENISPQLKTEYNAGTFTFDKHHNSGYYMECNRKHNSCKIYKTKLEGGEWSKGRPVPFNKNTYSIGHPALTSDGRYMYFVSDMAGGRGGRDIYVSRKKAEGNWTLPVNAGKEINTVADEMFPWILGDSLLFFASKRKKGYGGLDLYASFIYNDQAGEAVHLSKPFNSPSDDFSMILNDDSKGGYFVSNRNYKNSDDIYSFPKFPISVRVQGKITKKGTGEPFARAMVIFEQPGNFTDTIRSDSNGNYTYIVLQPYTYYEIECTAPGFHAQLQPLTISDPDVIYKRKPHKIDFALQKAVRAAIAGKVLNREDKQPMPDETLQLAGTNGTKKITTTNEDGQYQFEELPANAAYTVKISKEGYFAESRECVIPIIEEPTVFSKDNGCDMDFLLTKIQKEKEIVLQDIYYDFDKATLRPTSKKELDKLASMLKETPRVVIQINSHTDSRGSQSYNMRLSKRRAKSVVDYLTKKGVNPERLSSKGYGESQPLISQAGTEAEHQINRRTSFNILEIRETGDSKELVSAEQEDDLTFRIQLLVSKSSIETDKRFNDILQKLPSLGIITSPTSTGLFRYEAGAVETIDEARKMEQQIKQLGYKDAFLVAYHRENKIPLKKAMEMIGKKSVKLK
ncbi:MAG: OmpA family protein [Bacteroidales bacterium]|nr:OmpA family protein [Bacteroidales bacterium]